MLQPTIDYFQKRLPGWTWFPEVIAPYGVADIVFVRVDDELLQKRIKSGITPDPSRSYLLDRFKPGEWLDCKQARSWACVESTRVHLNILARERLLLRKRSGRKYVYSSNPDFVNPIQEIVSVELKLSDWKTVYQQAHLRRYFADKSYAVLALKGEICNKVIDHFRKTAMAGVGLLFAKPHIEMALEYEANGWVPTKRDFVCEEILRRMGVIPCLTNQGIDIQETTSSTNASVTSASGNGCSETSGRLGTSITTSLMGTLFADPLDQRK